MENIVFDIYIYMYIYIHIYSKGCFYYQHVKTTSQRTYVKTLIQQIFVFCVVVHTMMFPGLFRGR